jgi:outer membrane protein TolC
MPDVLRAGADDRVTPVIQMTAKSGEGLASVRAVTLAEVLQTARADALAVLESAARLDAAAGMARAAAGALWPGVSVGLGASHLDGTQVGSFGEVRDVSFARLEPAATIFYHVNPVAAVARSDARRRDVDAAAMDVAEAERAAMLQGAVAYYDLLLASAARDVATVLLRDAEGFLAIAGARAEAEVGSGGEPTAFVCEGGVCELPTSDPDVFRGQIAKVKPLLDAPASDRSPGRRSW